MAGGAGGHELCTGVVKSYNGLKGFGFLACEGIEGDIFFGRQDLPEDCREVDGNFLGGRQLSFLPLQAEKGSKASSVHFVVEDGLPYPGVVKTFNEVKGYGFISSSCYESDVRFDRKEFPNLPPGFLPNGKLVTFHVEALPDGKLRGKRVQFQSNEAVKGFFGGFVGGFGGMPQQGKGMQIYQPVQPVYQPVQPVYQPVHQPKQFGGGGSSTGTVKSFSEKNGYGFITVPGQPDIKFGQAQLVPGAEVSAGTTVRFKMVQSPDGRLSAQQVALASSPSAKGGLKRPVLAMGGAYVNGGGSPQKIMKGGKGAAAAPVPVGRLPSVKAERDPGAESTGQWLSGAIKSFSDKKGFGFITSHGMSEDIFFMRSDLPPEVQAGVEAGMGVSFELMTTPQGKLRAQTITVG